MNGVVCGLYCSPWVAQLGRRCVMWVAEQHKRRRLDPTVNSLGSSSSSSGKVGGSPRGGGGGSSSGRGGSSQSPKVADEPPLKGVSAGPGGDDGRLVEKWAHPKDLHDGGDKAKGSKKGSRKRDHSEESLPQDGGKRKKDEDGPLGELSLSLFAHPVCRALVWAFRNSCE